MTQSTRVPLRDDALILAAYLSALAVAVVVGFALEGRGAVYVGAAADLAATFVVFAWSVRYDNSSFYDAYWSVAPPLLAVWYGTRPGNAVGSDPRAWLVLALVTVWGVRLTWNWRRGWHGISHEDWRYVQFRHSAGRAYWLVSATGLHLFPTVQVFLGCLPLVPALAHPERALGVLDLAAVIVTAGAIAMEWIADNQLRRFVLTRTATETVLETGVWAWSRHPNYFGEMSFWWGIYLFGLAADPGWWWSGIGALAITVMFFFASVPMIDKRMLARRPAYAERLARVSAVIPWPPRAARHGR